MFVCETRQDTGMVINTQQPVNMMKYKLSIQFYKYYNDLNQIDTWLDLYFQQNFKNKNKFVTKMIHQETKLDKTI